MDYALARLNMVESQVRTNKVLDQRLVAALRTLERERFAPPALVDVAYIDEELPLPGGRFLLEPMVLARLLQEAQLTEADRVLDIGCGTGYSTALIAELAASVVGLEANAELSAEAARLVTRSNAAIVTGPLAAGWVPSAPYDVIVLQGAVPMVPDALFQQLADGGRLIAVVRPTAATGQAVLFVKHASAISKRPVFDASTPQLPGFALAQGFRF
jgi:protein-L-isoaspartate(D-aspartate) O-methyltransferase